MPDPRPDDDANANLTGVGCVLTLITVALMFGVALPLVRWRDPATGQPLPRAVAIFSPFILGAIFFGAASQVLKLIRLPVWSEREADGSGPAHD